MPQIGSTVYTPRGTETHVSGLPEMLGGRGVGSAPWAGMGLLDQLIAKRMVEHEAEWNTSQQAAQLAKRGAERRNRMESQAEAESTGEGRRGFGPEFDPMEAAVKREAQKAAIAQYQAQYQPVPRELTGVGITTGSGYADRTGGLSGAQRQAYLPQKSLPAGRWEGLQPITPQSDYDRYGRYVGRA